MRFLPGILNFLFSLSLLVIMVPPLEAQEPDVYEIVDTIDKLYRSETSRSTLEMTIGTENWSRTLLMDMWTEGLSKTFIHITGPRKDAGISTLRIENEMWNYFPKINKVMKVPPSMMMSSWMGSDFTNDDIVKESSMTRDYTIRLITPEDADPENHYIELIPKKDIPIVWAKIILVVDRKGYTPVEESYFDEKGREMRVMEFSEVKTFGERSIPSVLEMRTLKKKGKKTVIRYKDIHFDVQLKPDVFTLRNLQRKR
jgi:outer membrane lipoprotein-sorting protein